MNTEIIISKDQYPAFKDACNSVKVKIKKTVEGPKDFTIEIEHEIPQQLYTLGTMTMLFSERDKILQKWDAEIKS